MPAPDQPRREPDRGPKRVLISAALFLSLIGLFGGIMMMGVALVTGHPQTVLLLGAVVTVSAACAKRLRSRVENNLRATLDDLEP